MRRPRRRPPRPSSPPPPPPPAAPSDPAVPPRLPWVPPSRPAPRARRWGWPFALLGGLLLVFVAVATWVPTNRYAIAPGTASPVAPRLDLSAKTYDSKGKLLFVTVGIPKLSVLGRIVGSLDPDVSVKTAREVFGDQTREQNRQQNLKLMSYSKEIAAYVALKRLGYTVGLTGGGPVIQSLCLQYQDENDPKSVCVKDSPADAVLDPGDAIVAVDGHPVVLAEDIAPLLAGKAPGDTVIGHDLPEGLQGEEGRHGPPDQRHRRPDDHRLHPGRRRHPRRHRVQPARHGVDQLGSDRRPLGRARLHPDDDRRAHAR